MIMEDAKKTDPGATVVQEQVEDGAEVLDPNNCRSVVSNAHKTINNKLEHERLDNAVPLLNACLIHQTKNDHVPGNMYSIPCLPGAKYLAYKVSVISLIVRTLVWDLDIQEALVAAEVY